MWREKLNVQCSFVRCEADCAMRNANKFSVQHQIIISPSSSSSPPFKCDNLASVAANLWIMTAKETTRIAATTAFAIDNENYPQIKRQEKTLRGHLGCRWRQLHDRFILFVCFLPQKKNNILFDILLKRSERITSPIWKPVDFLIALHYVKSNECQTQTSSNKKFPFLMPADGSECFEGVATFHIMIALAKRLTAFIDFNAMIYN